MRAALFLLAVSLNGQDLQRSIDRAEACAARGDFTCAEAAYADARALARDRTTEVGLRQRRANALFKLDRLLEAAEEMKAVLALDDTPQNRAALAAIEKKASTTLISAADIGKALTARSLTPSANRPADGIDLWISFGFNKDTLDPNGERQTEELVKAIRESMGSVRARYLLVGHTDAVGSHEFNDALSLRRANRVRERLVQSGIDRSLIDTKGMGKRRLKDPGNDAVNRRVEVQLVVTD